MTDIFIRLYNDNKGEVKSIVLIVLAIVLGAILTGATMPAPISSMMNATVNTSNNAVPLINANSATKSSFETIPVMYAIAAFLVPVVIIVKYLDLA